MVPNKFPQSVRAHPKIKEGSLYLLSHPQAFIDGLETGQDE